MIITRLMGGLGNQMFQYAAGRRLAHRLNASLSLDLSCCSEPGARPFRLPAFQIDDKAAENLHRILLDHALPRSSPLWWGRMVRRVRRRLLWTFLVEDSVGPVRTDVLGARGNVYLSGYWQSERYFSDIEPILRREFQPREPLSGAARAWADRITATEGAVSIHVRRGDYISHPVLDTCTSEYYREAARCLVKRVSQPMFFIFSDDPSGLEEYLCLDHPTVIVPPRQDREHEDMLLMSRCRHHIIANSSFSWWGAWLNPAPDKLVIAPRRWSLNHNQDTRDILPAQWVAL